MSKVESYNKILIQLINHHKKAVETAKKTVSTNIQMLTLFITTVRITS
jgi:hypothetical protein